MPDLDDIDALRADREALWTRLQGTSFLSDDEKRAAVGYGPLAIATDAGEAAQKFNPHHDAAGRFTSASGGGGATPVAGRPRGPVGPPKPPPAGAPTGPVPVPPGMTLRNQALAGKKHPQTGIPYDAQGFPDFSGVAQKTVRVPHTGDRGSDCKAADRAAGFAKTPDNMTWHHHQDGHTMQLVPFDIHWSTGHTGCIGIGNTPGKR